MRGAVMPHGCPTASTVKHWRDGAPIVWIARALRVGDPWVRKGVDRFVEGGQSWAALDDRSSRRRQKLQIL